MLVEGATPELPIKNKGVKADEIDKLNEKLMQFKKIAQRKVPWFSPLCFFCSINQVSLKFNSGYKLNGLRVFTKDQL